MTAAGDAQGVADAEVRILDEEIVVVNTSSTAGNLAFLAGASFGNVAHEAGSLLLELGVLFHELDKFTGELLQVLRLNPFHASNLLKEHPQHIEEVQQQASGKTVEVRKQLDRASLSALNIAEGNGKRQQPTRAKFFDDARGSTSESAACLDALAAKGVCPKQRVEEGKEMLRRVFSMLTKLVQKFDAHSSSSSPSSSIPSTTTRRTRTSEFSDDVDWSPRNPRGSELGR